MPDRVRTKPTLPTAREEAERIHGALSKLLNDKHFSHGHVGVHAVWALDDLSKGIPLGTEHIATLFQVGLAGDNLSMGSNVSVSQRVMIVARHVLQDNGDEAAPTLKPLDDELHKTIYKDFQEADLMIPEVRLDDPDLSP